MIQNKMEEVAKLLGLELEEEFKIYGYDGFSKITELGLERYVKEKGLLMDSIMLTDLIKGTAKIIKIPKPILDEKEKEYLSNVIKPFRDRVICIKKYEDFQDEYLGIHVKYHDSEVDVETIVLPCFKRGTLYKNMLIKKSYTLEELEL